MPTSISILYLGPIAGTCLDRANALRRLGHSVEHIDLRALLPKTLWVDRVTWRIGGQVISPLLLKSLSKELNNIKSNNNQFDLCYVDGGELVTPRVISLLRMYSKIVINYNIDDPIGPRDKRRFKAYRLSLPFYDLNVVIRQENVEELEKLKAKKVMRVYRSADEVSHAPRQLEENDYKNWSSEVLFLGTWFPERGPFLLKLIELDIPLTIRGANWHKAPEWPKLKSNWKGGNITGDDYAKAIQCAKVNLGLLSKENRDLHTTRSLEIPALGGLLCAERTIEHTSMYVEGKEAIFWNDADECAEMCRYTLRDEKRRQAIAKAGNLRVKKNKHYNEDVLSEILTATGLVS
jgi:spore maturation protein CgeB